MSRELGGSDTGCSIILLWLALIMVSWLTAPFLFCLERKISEPGGNCRCGFPFMYSTESQLRDAPRCPSD